MRKTLCVRRSRSRRVDRITKREQSRWHDRRPDPFPHHADCGRAARARGLDYKSRRRCVNFRGGTDATAYFTDDLQDAFEHGRAMALAGPPAPVEPAGRRRKWRRPMSAKAQRRRMIKAHNRRMRGRALREQRGETGASCLSDRGGAGGRQLSAITPCPDAIGAASTQRAVKPSPTATRRGAAHRGGKRAAWRAGLTGRKLGLPKIVSTQS
jgi:hypothetical protein